MLLFIILLLLLSFALIVKGADFLVDGAADIARWLKVSPLLVGLTIVAFGTSLPEFVVSLFSVLGGSGDLALGNVIGSNIVNIGLILGITAIVAPLAVRAKTLMYEFPFLIVASFLLLILGNNQFIFGEDSFGLGRVDGLSLLVVFALFIWYVFHTANHERQAVKQEFQKKFLHRNTGTENTLLILGGLIGLFLGGRLFIYSATKLAGSTGISEAFIGVIIAAVGTSLPELATSIAAAWKKQSDIALGNILGSNIFNILFVLGITPLVLPFSVSGSLLQIDAVIMVAFSLLLLLFATRDRKVGRVEGLVLVIAYLLYAGYQVVGVF